MDVDGPRLPSRPMGVVLGNQARMEVGADRAEEPWHPIRNSAAKPSYVGRRRSRQPPYPRIRRFCSVIPSTPQTSPQIALANRANLPSPTREPGHATHAPLLHGSKWTRMDPDLLRCLYGCCLMEPGPDGGESGSRGASVAPMRNSAGKPR